MPTSSEIKEFIEILRREHLKNINNLIGNILNRFIYFGKDFNYEIKTFKSKDNVLKFSPYAVIGYPTVHVAYRTFSTGIKLYNVEIGDDYSFFSVEKDSVLDIRNLSQGQYRLYLKKLELLLSRFLTKYTVKNAKILDYNPKFSIMKYAFSPQNTSYKSFLKQMLNDPLISKLVKKLERQNIIDSSKITSIDHLLYQLFVYQSTSEKNISRIIAFIIIKSYELLANRFAYKKNLLGGRFWFINFALVKFLYALITTKNVFKTFYQYIFNKENIAKLWNVIFRNIGINAVIDYGLGIIGNEKDPHLIYVLDKRTIKDVRALSFSKTKAPKRHMPW